MMGLKSSRFPWSDRALRRVRNFFLMLFGAIGLTVSRPVYAEHEHDKFPSIYAKEPRGEAVEDFWKRAHMTDSWGGSRTELSERGVEFTVDYLGEVLGSCSGGSRTLNPKGRDPQGVIYEGRAEWALDIDFEKLTSVWKGGRFHVCAYEIHGTDLTGQYLGNLMPVSNIEAFDTLRLFELWMEQTWMDDRISLRAGELAADSEFLISDYASLFINGTFGWAAMVANNAVSGYRVTQGSGFLPAGGAPAYPVAGPGIRLRVSPIESIELMGAVFDGNADPGEPSGHPLNNSGTRFNINKNEGLFSIFEMNYRFNSDKDSKGLPGSYKMGGWYSTGRFADSRFDNGFGLSIADTTTDVNGDGAADGTGLARVRDGNYGIYFVADQMVFREKETGDEGLGIFWRIGGSPPDRNPIDFYSDWGLNYKGLIPGRDQDVLGVGVAFAHLSDDQRKLANDTNQDALNPASNNFGNALAGIPDEEVILEVTYQFQMTPWWFLQPDFQWIFQPRGLKSVDDIVIFGARIGVCF